VRIGCGGEVPRNLVIQSVLGKLLQCASRRPPAGCSRAVDMVTIMNQIAATSGRIRTGEGGAASTTRGVSRPSIFPRSRTNQADHWHHF